MQNDRASHPHRPHRHGWLLPALVLAAAAVAGCNLTTATSPGSDSTIVGEHARVVRVIDGDTIDVRIDGAADDVRVRYVGINTPERDEPCFRDATDANSSMVAGREVTMVRDTSDTDRYGRLLRYIYVGDVFVNRVLIEQGYAEVVRYGSDDAFFDSFRTLEQAAARASIGCHATGIFDDGNYER